MSWLRFGAKKQQTRQPSITSVPPIASVEKRRDSTLKIRNQQFKPFTTRMHRPPRKRLPPPTEAELEEQSYHGSLPDINLVFKKRWRLNEALMKPEHADICCKCLAKAYWQVEPDKHAAQSKRFTRYKATLCDEHMQAAIRKP